MNRHSLGMENTTPRNTVLRAASNPCSVRRAESDPYSFHPTASDPGSVRPAARNSFSQNIEKIPIWENASWDENGGKPSPKSGFFKRCVSQCKTPFKTIYTNEEIEPLQRTITTFRRASIKAFSMSFNSKQKSPTITEPLRRAFSVNF